MRAILIIFSSFYPSVLLSAALVQDEQTQHFFQQNLLSERLHQCRMTSPLIHKSNNRPDDMLPIQDGLMCVLTKKINILYQPNYKTIFPASSSTLIIITAMIINDITHTQLLKPPVLVVNRLQYPDVHFSYLLLLKVAMFDG